MDFGEFEKLVTKFLFLNCADHWNDSNEINSLLNELNSINFNVLKIMDQNTVFNLFDSITTTPTTEETLIVKSCYLISTIISKQKIQLPSGLFEKLIDWLSKCLELNFQSVACDVLSCLKTLLKHHPNYCIKLWDKFLLPDTLLIRILNTTIIHKLPKDYDTNSNTEILISIILCIQNLISSSSLSDDTQLADTNLKILEILGTKILDLIYLDKIHFNNSTQEICFISSVLNILYQIANNNHEWTENNLGRLLGIAKSYIHYGLPDITKVKPQKIVVSQQSLLEPIVTTTTNKGGRILKTHKLKTVSKNKKADKNKNLQENQMSDSYTLRTNVDVNFDLNLMSPFNRTSDSDFSGSERAARGGIYSSQNEMHKQAKQRLSAISLIGLIAKILDKKILYGYWHALFPSESLSHNSPEFLNCILRDPNPRNRTVALQITSILLFNSKSFLMQAENSDKAPKTFTPFSISLGNMVLATYDVLTQALSSEISLPVLTQVLKCLSVLIQNTPFHRLRCGFVTNFVKYIRQLVYHKDPTIQVAALIVMEFLISVQEITAEIFECIGSSKKNLNSIRQNQYHLNDSGVEEIIENELDEEEILSESDQEDEIDKTKLPSTFEENKDNKPEMSWLLQIVLENLGISFPNTRKLTKVTVPVRIESLQILSSMALHFLLIKDHLELISNALKSSLNDNQSDIRLYTSKCLDVIGHSINKHLLENSTDIDKDLTVCQNFWINILPSTIEKIQDFNQNSALKGYLCDFLSNMGVHIYERLPQNVNIKIISLLSGISCNEESIVRAAAVRALAVYTAFPSLRGDLCFIENTAELTIKLMKDSNLYARIKASWALGNISDAFLINSNDSRLDSVSNELLKKMLEVAIDETNDNDKVRSNAVRTLGNLLRLVSQEHLRNSENWRMLCVKAIEKLTNCINLNGSAKVKWNSCYAIGNFMKNESLFDSYGGNFNWKKFVFPSLCKLIVNNSNFKVRINGASALTVINKREYYGDYMNQIWSSLLLAIEQSDNLIDFNEYKHRDNLQEQLCLTLSHTIKIATKDDLLFFKSELVPKLEAVKQIWIRVLNRILPESAASLMSCTIQLNYLLLKNNLTNEQKNSIQIISSCLTRYNQEF